jgi:hypothetical protein
MKRVPIPPEAFLGVIELHGPMTLDEICIASRTHTARMVRKLRDDGRVHICGWAHNGGTNGAGMFRMIVAAGLGENIPRPKMNAEEFKRRERDRNRKYRESHRKPKAAPPPPQLPTHTPTLGIWGL